MVGHRPRLVAAALVAPALLLGGCATMFTGTSDTLTFDANVPGVRLSVDGRHLGELPLTVPMSRNFMGGKRFLAKFEKDGYQTQEFELAREFNTVAILDVSSTLVSGGVDVLTGALLRFSPKEVHVQMLEAGKRATSGDFRRSLAIHELALVNHHALQRDLARGGGERLAALGALVAGPQDGPRVEAAALRAARPLVTSPTPHALVRELNRMLDGDPALRAYRF